MTTKFWIARRSALTGLLATAGVLHVAPAWAVGECSKFGKPTYQADRLVRLGGETVRSRVYVMGDMEREEIDRGGRIEVIIIARGQMITYSPDTKVGLRRSLGAMPKPKINKDSVRLREESSGTGAKLILETRSDDGSWTKVDEVTCRRDGVVLAKSSTVPINGRMVPMEMMQQIRGGPVDRNLFTPPSDIKFQR